MRVPLATISMLLTCAVLLPAETDRTDESTPRELTAGTAMTSNEASFLARLQWQLGPEYGWRVYECLGVQISRYWLLTAAHCVHGQNGRKLRVRYFRGNDITAVGQHPDYAEDGQIQVHMHPDYKANKMLHDSVNDIALLRLPSHWQPAVRPTVARLPTALEALTVQPGLTVRTIGKTGRYSPSPTYADWPVTNCPSSIPPGALLCMEKFPQWLEPGDSGGPTLMEVGGEWVLIGINGSETSNAVIAAKTSHHHNWIAGLVGGIEPRDVPEPRDASEPESTLTLTLENKTGTACSLTMWNKTGTHISSTISTNSKTSLSLVGQSSQWNLLLLECEP